MKKLQLKDIKVSIVIPCFNESDSIKDIIKAVIDSPVQIKLYIKIKIKARALLYVPELVMLPEI